MFDRRQFMVKERVGFLKLTDTYDIFDLNSSAQLGTAHEAVSPLIKVLRLLINKRLLPTSIEVRASAGGPALLTIKRGVGFLRTPVQVLDQQGRQIGSEKLLEIVFDGTKPVKNGDQFGLGGKTVKS